jgi:hypothetical protein
MKEFVVGKLVGNCLNPLTEEMNDKKSVWVDCDEMNQAYKGDPKKSDWALEFALQYDADLV